MLRLVSEITIEGDYTWLFTAVGEVNIVQDIASLTDTCELKLPKKIKWQNTVKEFGKPPVKRGDKITVKLGYDGELETIFSGFIRSVDAQVPIVIKCEDGMFILKQQVLTPKAYKNASLKDIVTDLLAGSGIDFKLIDDNLKIGKYRFTRKTVSEELQELKERYMLMSYFRRIDDKEVLYVGLAYPTDNRKTLFFRHSKNIISEDFEYRVKEDIRVKVEAISFDAKNKKTTIELGDKDGDLIKIRIDGISDTELKKYAQQALDRYKQSGFKGSFETFGVPEVSKCDIVDIFSSDGNKGAYLVKKNEISFGLSGYRQKIELGQPLSIETNQN